MPAASRLLCIATLAAASACEKSANMVRIEPGAAVDSLVFHVSAAGEPNSPGVLAYGLSVLACADDRPFWTIAADGTRAMPRDVRYGGPIPGFPTNTGPLPLVPGCYDVIVSGGPRIRFTVTAARRVVPRDTSRLQSMLENGRSLEIPVHPRRRSAQKDRPI